MKRTVIAALLCATALPAFALTAPPPGKDDSHMRVEAYSDMNRVALTMSVNRMTNISFGPNERIKRFAMGMQGLESCPVGVPRNKDHDNDQPFINNLPLIGLKAGSTDLLVITLLPDGAERTYQFVLKVEPDGDDTDATFGLRFTYPVQQAAAAKIVAAANWQKKQADDAKRVAEDRMAQDVFYGPRNWKYVAQGKDKEIAPTEVSDNTRITAFRYPANMAQPTIYIVDADGNELTAPTINRDDLLIVQRTAPHFRLRLGQRVLDIFNRGYDPIGENPGTGTTSPGVVREVVAQAPK